MLLLLLLRLCSAVAVVEVIREGCWETATAAGLGANWIVQEQQLGDY